MRTYAALAVAALLVSAAIFSTVTSFASFGAGEGNGGIAGGVQVHVDLNVQGDPCGHDQFIWGANNPPPHNLTLNVLTSPAAGTISISGPSPFVNVNGTMQAGNAFSAQGMGTVAGIPNVSVGMEGTWDGATLTGKYTMGAQGELPPCGPIGAQVPHPAVYGVKPKVTPTPTRTRTPTPTPPQKLYSIIVLKQNADNFQPLSGWHINLYAGGGCQGSSINALTTNSSGFVDFTGLPPGSYSVQEKSQAGWNPTGPVCQNVTLGGPAGPAGVACPVSPDQAFPLPGCDRFFSGARVIVRVNATGEETAVNLNGPTLIERINAPADHNTNGLDDIQTEIIQLDLSGGGITVRQSPTRPSMGLIEEQANITPGTLDFPADSFFDVFFEVDFAGLTLHNETPFRIACKIEQVPPYLCFYQPPVPEGIPLLNADGVKIATLLHGKHIPLPPNESLIIFTNRPKVTPTPTATRTPTRTPTGTPGTPPPNQTPTPTPTPANPPPNGDCVKTGQNVPFQGAVWGAAWKCTPGAAVHPFNRIDVAIGTATQVQKLSAASFVCQQTGEKAAGVLKGHKKDVNPGTNLPNHEVWSGDFHEKCTGGVTVYLQTVDPANHAIIQQVAFTNTSGAATPTPTPASIHTATPTPHKALGDVNDDGAVNSIDASLILQLQAGLIHSLPNMPSADTTHDGVIDSRDALLVLQYDARLLHCLPCAAGRASAQAGVARAVRAWLSAIW